MLNLFDTPIISGLQFRSEIITRSEENALTAHIDAANLQPFRFQQWAGKRLTRSFGWSFDFQTGGFASAESIPDWLLPLRACAAEFAELDPCEFMHALVIRYDLGAGIGWHKDRPVYEHVIGISLGAEASLRFRRRKEEGFTRATVPLPPRSIYHLSGEARWDWEHSISPMDRARWSVTFRTLSSKGRSISKPK